MDRAIIAGIVVGAMAVPTMLAANSAPAIFKDAPHWVHQAAFVGGLLCSVVLVVVALGLGLGMSGPRLAALSLCIAFALLTAASLLSFIALGDGGRPRPSGATPSSALVPAARSPAGVAQPPISSQPQPQPLQGAGWHPADQEEIHGGQAGVAVQGSEHPIPDRVTPYSGLSTAQLADKLAMVAAGLRDFERTHRLASKRISEAEALPDADADRAQRAEMREQLEALVTHDTQEFRVLFLFDARDLVDEASKRLKRPRPADQAPSPLSRDGSEAFNSGFMRGAGLSNLADYLDALAVALRSASQ